MSVFNLVDSPWLPVLDTSNQYRTVGLAEAFDSADTLTVAAGGGLEDTAIHRLLLAVAYTALGAPTPDTYPQPPQTEQIVDWLHTHREDFELLDSPAPFAQDAALAHSDAPELLPGLINPYLGRNRPKVTDWRSLNDTPTMTFADAARWLIVQLAYSVGGRHEGVSQSLPESPLTGLIAFRPTGTLTDTLTWARIPVLHVGDPNWTYRDRADVGGGVRGVRPTSDLDALTWMSRRFLLHHNGTHVTGLQQAGGWRRAPEPDDLPFDSAPGRHDIAVAATPSKPAKASGIGGRSWQTSSGDPVGLSIAWERGGPDSFSHYVRTASTHLPPPEIVATGHQIESKVLWQGGFATVIPRPDRAHTVRAQQVTAARSKARRFGDLTDTDLLTLRTDPDADTDSTVATLATVLRPPAPAHAQTPWPQRTTSIWAANQPADNKAVTDSLNDLHLDDGYLAILNEAAAHAHRDTPDTHAPDVWRYLLTHPDHAARLATLTRIRTPDPADMPPLDTIDPTADGLRVWTGLAATWLTQTPRPRWTDTSTPLPTALRHAAAATRSNRPRHLITTLTAAPRTPTALRAPLLDALTVLYTAGKAPSWRSLHYDLTHWDTTTARHWATAFHTPTTTEGHAQ